MFEWNKGAQIYSYPIFSPESSRSRSKSRSSIMIIVLSFFELNIVFAWSFLAWTFNLLAVGSTQFISSIPLQEDDARMISLADTNFTVEVQWLKSLTNSYKTEEAYNRILRNEVLLNLCKVMRYDWSYWKSLHLLV